MIEKREVTLKEISYLINEAFDTSIQPTTMDYDATNLGLSTATFHMNGLSGISKIVAFYRSYEVAKSVAPVYVSHIITSDVGEIKEKYPGIFSAHSVAAYLEAGMEKNGSGNKVFFDKRVPICSLEKFSLKNFDTALSDILELMDSIKDKYTTKLAED